MAIVGAPNVGKSTLLNCLLGEERAMVSEIAGTTRDSIEETANIDGVRFRFIDTAGIRSTNDRLERMGIERTMTSIARAQIIVRMYDARDISAHPELLSATPEFTLQSGQTLLRAVNKLDTTPALQLPEGVIGLAAKSGEGIESLREKLRASVDTTALYHGDAVVSNNRHYEALTAARESLDRALAGLGIPHAKKSEAGISDTENSDAGISDSTSSGAECLPADSRTTAARPTDSLPTDLLSEEIRQVIHHIGTITGQIASDEILRHIFSKFCIGK